MAAVPVYRIVQQFLRIQAIGTRGTRTGDYADPVALEVVVDRGTGETPVEIERVNAATPGQTRLRRLRTGNWMFQVDPAKLDFGVTYTVRWRYEMQPGVVNVAHQSFIWNPVPDVPVDPDNVVLYGMLADTLGAPMSEHRLIMEAYEDPTTLSRRTGQTELATDVFGNWSVEVPKGKIVQAPRDRARAALGELTPFQPRDIIRRDKYGYPAPGMDLFKLLAQQLTQRQAMAVLQSTAVTQFITENSDDSGNVPTGSVEIFSFTQSTPATPWIIPHGKDCFPVVSVLDEDDSVVLADVSFPDRNTAVITFAEPTAGTAILVCTVDGQETPL